MSSLRSQTITLPYPPSLNTYWRSIVIGGSVRVLISKEGRAYRQIVHKMLAVQRAVHYGAARLKVSISAFPPDRRDRDLDNLPKALFDALSDEHDKKSGITVPMVWGDDCQVDEYTIRRAPVVKGGKVVVTITEIEIPPEQATLLEAA